MIHLMVGFFTSMLRSLSKPWWTWVGALMLANMLVPLLFIRSVEAKVVLATFMVAAGLQMVLFSKLGFVRLLGIGHLPWLPLVFWLSTRLSAVGDDEALRTWLWTLIVLNSVSLVIDSVDVARYLAGDRAPSDAVRQS